jgi:hypothetical protein
MRISLPVALALALAGCGKQAQAPAVQPSEKSADVAATADTVTRPAMPPVEDPDEVQLESLAGVWRVIGVMPGKSARFAADDRRIVGALMDVTPETLSWSYHPDEAFAPEDLCLGPVSGIIAHAEIAQEIRGLLAPALAAARQGRARVSRPHHWLCGDGGSWGEDAEFQVIGEDQMAMRWPGDLTLVLERIKRISSGPPDLPPTGAFQGR